VKQPYGINGAGSSTIATRRLTQLVELALCFANMQWGRWTNRDELDKSGNAAWSSHFSRDAIIQDEIHKL